MSDDETPYDRVADQVVPITKELAHQFALILGSGMPHLDAIGYLRPDLEGQDAKVELDRWMRHRVVQTAILELQGGAWQDMPTERKIAFTIDKHYTELAYYLYRNNYNDLDGAARAKADICRQTLEAKLAGMAGKLDALSTFFEDIKSGKVHLKHANTVQ